MAAGVYIIKVRNTRNHHMYKIGKSADYEKRLAKLQTGCPFPLELLCFLPAKNPQTLESTLHNIFKTRRKSGEWFQLRRKDIKHLLQIATRRQLQDAFGQSYTVPIKYHVKAPEGNRRVHIIIPA